MSRPRQCEKLTHAEIAGMFPAGLPLDAVRLIMSPDEHDGPDDLRRKLRVLSPGTSVGVVDVRELIENTIHRWFPNADAQTVIAVARDVALTLRAYPPAGMVMVPREPTEAWVHALVNWRQGQRETPRCEPPGRFELDRARRDIREVLSSAPKEEEGR